ncbi:rho GTPase-activating protein 3 [Ziziphus jujuba]|uniref:Rho GTPase-activating protein 3 n=1 Tax=Ziziphus jujuba TaxID=326968 RepID=A0ABM3ITV8_ZIZJJ|nr:rho GTPase-activating protein 3 [Ziziphus jujuba]
MTRLFRSKSCGLVGLTDFNMAPPSSPFFNNNNEDDDEDEDDDEGGGGGGGVDKEFEEEGDEDEDEVLDNPMSTPFISTGSRDSGSNQGRHFHAHGQHNQSPILDVLVGALRKSLVTCSVEREDVASSLDISWPTEVRHVSHVTFDRFNGFLGLPRELEPEVPRRVPSASVSVFGVSAQSMQCSYDHRGNSVPTILLMMQKRLYSGGGLQAEGIFRINADNSQEERVRDQLNRGVVPHGIDVHCLAGLIKAWFRELPTGVLDSLTPEQVMHCNTEDECAKLVMSLPSINAALLDWAVNLMADVVQHEQFNKMNARNIAMVFAPNMTQMADPLTALIHAVQVMNFLKTLILKVLREREESDTKPSLLSTCSKSFNHKSGPITSDSNKAKTSKQSSDACATSKPANGNSLRAETLDCQEGDIDEKLWCSQIKSDEENNGESSSGSSTPEKYAMAENECRGGYESGEWRSLREGVRKLCRHPVFQLSKPANKKTASLGIVNTRGGGGEAWA